ncbi:hypothetical protein HNR40_003435 [Nonomuraea endophytica]|uniref:Uncharacterized protein n=1 Tax=Nonomuraea endophytica TaxID=714136 RepID=A0A7W8A362_9ACTN|nr:hypothetical protein [Nonomuraea endophytica]
MSSNAPVIAPETFHGLFGRIADALDPHTEGSKVGVMLTLMSAYSAYVGYGPSVETGKGSTPLALWGVWWDAPVSVRRAPLLASRVAW